MKNAPQNNQEKKTIQIIFCGDAAVGKTALISRFKNNFVDIKNQVPTIGVDYTLINLKINNEEVKLKLVDLPGQQRFTDICRQVVRNVGGVIYVYDINSRESYQNIQNWLELVKSENEEDIPSLLIGNKSDQKCNTSLSQYEAQIFASQNNLQFFETSALNGNEVHNSIRALANKIYAQDIGRNQQQMCAPLQQYPQQQIPRIKLSPTNTKTKQCFPGSALVQIEGVKTTIAISQLQVGQKVVCLSSPGLFSAGTVEKEKLSTQQFYEKVLSFLHYDPNAEADFIELETIEGEIIAATSKHMIFLKHKHSTTPIFIPIEASSLGDSIFHRKKGWVRIVSIKIVHQKGLFSPLTNSGTLFVNDFLVSCFISYSPYQSQILANIVFTPLKLWCSIKNRKTVDGQHKYCQVLRKIGTALQLKME